MQTFKLETDFITITQLLKALDYITSGGEAKFFLLDNKVFLETVKITEKKKKLIKGDTVLINDKRIVIT